MADGVKVAILIGSALPNCRFECHAQPDRNARGCASSTCTNCKPSTAPRATTSRHSTLASSRVGRQLPRFLGVSRARVTQVLRSFGKNQTTLDRVSDRGSDSTRCLLDMVARPICQDGARNHVNEVVRPRRECGLAGEPGERRHQREQVLPIHIGACPFPWFEHGAVVVRPHRAARCLKHGARNQRPRGRSPSIHRRRRRYE